VGVNNWQVVHFYHKADNRVCELLFLGSLVVEVKTAVSFNWLRHCERRFFVIMKEVLQ
jgi:hypothetical protein